jgi:L-rhamnose isomerase
MKSRSNAPAYRLARERYAALGVDTDRALRQAARIPVSIHCWQGDDVGGFEQAGGQKLGDGLAVFGSYPGKARTPDELRRDFETALALIPGTKRFNLHALYAEMGGRHVDRDALGVEQFRGWISWAKGLGIGLDFNQTYFSHPRVKDGCTLTHPDAAVRRFWIEHGIRCREIGAAIGRALGRTCLTNLWIPDGVKDTPADRRGPRERLAASLDAIFARPVNPRHNVDAVEPKLFGLGSESYVPGSHEFYLGYAVSRGKLLTLDAGHYHPTEGIADSDHVVTLTDELQAIAQEIVWGGYTDRVRIGLDYFDASINRVAAWVIGTRNMQKALLLALVAPIGRIRAAEREGDLTTRLALLEEARTLPFSAVWDQYCVEAGVPQGERWLAEVKAYERTVLSQRAA